MPTRLPLAVHMAHNHVAAQQPRNLTQHYELASWYLSRHLAPADQREGLRLYAEQAGLPAPTWNNDLKGRVGVIGKRVLVTFVTAGADARQYEEAGTVVGIAPYLGLDVQFADGVVRITDEDPWRWVSASS